MRTIYSAKTEGVVALTTATPKSILGVSGPAQFGVDLLGFRVGFDGVTASAVPVVVELIQCTFATNPPGTASTSSTVNQEAGRTVTPGFTAAHNWSSEPTATTTVIDEWLLTPNGGLVFVELPDYRTPDAPVSQGFVIRCTAPANVNVRGTIRFGRC
jgi:hypothetical protein